MRESQMEVVSLEAVHTGSASRYLVCKKIEKEDIRHKYFLCLFCNLQSIY